MKIKSIILVWEYDREEILGAFNTWEQAKEFMCKDYLLTIQDCNWSEAESYADIAKQIAEDLEWLNKYNYIPYWYNTEEVEVNITW